MNATLSQTCSICGGPLRRTNVIGICRRTSDCRRACSAAGNRMRSNRDACGRLDDMAAEDRQRRMFPRLPFRVGDEVRLGLMVPVALLYVWPLVSQPGLPIADRKIDQAGVPQKASRFWRYIVSAIDKPSRRALLICGVGSGPLARLYGGWFDWDCVERPEQDA